MDEELKTEFDIIILGTGVVESLIAAAAARNGKKVLHLDRNAFYGGQWASFSLSGIQKWTESSIESPHITVGAIQPYLLNSDESLVPLSTSECSYTGAKYKWHVPESVDDIKKKKNEDDIQKRTIENDITKRTNDHIAKRTSDDTEKSTSNDDTEKRANDDIAKRTSDDDSKKRTSKSTKEENIATAEQGSEDSDSKVSEDIWTKDKLEKFNSRFNIDLAPKILYSRGPLVELLISSNVARYVEFKCITRILTWLKGENEESEGQLISVPCSRSDVFTTDVINLIEKRLLMKFLEFCLDFENKEDEWSEYADKPFGDLLRAQHLTPKLIHFITSSIGMVSVDVNCKEGLKKTSLFLNSLGRYGSMPFLFTLYGSAEIPQAFCRLCAVFEGIYILKRSVEYLVRNQEGRVTGLISQGQRFCCKNIAMDASYSPENFREKCNMKQLLSRGILITDKSILVDKKEHVTLFRVPSCNTHPEVTVIEVGSGAGVCAPNTYLVHLLCYGEDAECEFKPTLQRLFSQEGNSKDKPNIIFSLFFNQIQFDLESTGDLAPNVFICNGPHPTLDYDLAIAQAKDYFGKMYPGEDFLPRAPDHTEIVFDYDDKPPMGEKTSEKCENSDESSIND